MYVFLLIHLELVEDATAGKDWKKTDQTKK